MRFSVRRLTPAITALFCAGCTVAVHFGYGKPGDTQAYLAAIAKPMAALTNSASAANDSCLGGSRPDPPLCFTDTKIEISDALFLEKAMKSVSTPPGFVKANRDLLHGLDIFIQGLSKRNAGLAAHSASEYTAGSSLIRESFVLQRLAIAEYPPDAHISL